MTSLKKLHHDLLRSFIPEVRSAWNHLDLQFRVTLYVKQFQGYMQKSSCQYPRCPSWVWISEEL